MVNQIKGNNFYAVRSDQLRSLGFELRQLQDRDIGASSTTPQYAALRYSRVGDVDCDVTRSSLFPPSAVIDSTPKERNQIHTQPIHVRQHQAVRRSVIDNQAAARDQLRGLSAGSFERRRHILIPMNDENRYRDLA
jgi:hypothetical protein